MKKEICPVCKKEYDNKVGNTYHHSYTDDYGGYRSYDHVDVNAKIIGYREYTVKVPIYE